MSNNNLFSAMKVLIDSTNAGEVRKVYDFLVTKNPGIMEDAAFATLRGSEKVFGGVGKCESFLPLGIYIEGWLLPRNNYDIIEIYCKGNFLGYANLGVNRGDVYRNFKFYNEKNAGFNFFVTQHLQDIVDKHPLVVVAKRNNKVVKRIILNISNYSVKDSIEDLKNSICETKNILVPTLSNRMPMILKIAKQMPEYNFVTLLEGMEDNLETIKGMCQTKYRILAEELNQLSMFMMPKLFMRNNVPGFSELMLTVEEQRLYEQKDYIRFASENLSEKYNVSMEYAVKYCCAAHDYAEQLINIVKPGCVMIWNKYSPLHLVLDYVCKERNITVVYMESGLLPGTFIFETFGQMGESYPATHSKEFEELKVTKEELEEADRIKSLLFENKLNRWTSSDPSVYSKNEKQKVLEKLNPDRPTLLYAGQNDFESGLFPYTEYVGKYHSPVFESSNEAAIFLAKLAKKNDWNFIYKRHPMMRGKLNMEFPSNVIMSDNIDIHDAIDISDLTITILSQTSYVALLRDKPALMLGYHQLCHKGCVYEAWKNDELEDCIKQALEEGFTDKQKENFKKHIAQLCKYYLYTDFIDNTVDYGKSLGDLVKYLQKLLAKETVANYDLMVKEEIIIDEIPEERCLTQVSSFRFDLSIRERITRRKIKQLLAGKGFFGFGEKRAEAAGYLMSNQEHNNFYLNAMFIAQIEKALLVDYHWGDVFLEMFLLALKKGENYFEEFLIRCENLHDEIKNRLEIDSGIDNGFAMAFSKEDSCKKLLRICIIEEKKEIQRLCIQKLESYMTSQEDDCKQMLTEQLESVLKKQDLNSRERNYLLQLIFKYGLFTDKHMKQWNDILLRSEDSDVLYYFGGIELDRIGFLKPECIYPEYYQDRKKLLVHISEKMIEGAVYNKKKEKPENRCIAMLVVGLHGKLFASTRLQIGLANEMARRGYKVTIFVADTNYAIQDNYFAIMPGTIRRNFSKEIYKSDHLLMTDVNVDVRYFTREIGGKERYCDYISSIYEYNPLAIIDITNENAIYNPQLMKDYPVISVPLNGYRSSASCTAYIARDIGLLEKCNQEYNSIDMEHVYEANMYLPQTIEEEEYKRRKFGFSDKDFIVVTVGNRLDFELTQEIQEGMRDLLQCNRNLRWILVGRITSDFSILQEEQKRRQVVKWGYENNLSALYKMCDLYLDLPRSGGGGSVAFAVQVGVPAIIMNMPSDILPFLGEENSVNSWKEERKALLEAMESKIYCRKLLKRQQQSLASEKWSITHFGEVVETAINDLTKEGVK